MLTQFDTSAAFVFNGKPASLFNLELVTDGLVLNSSETDVSFDAVSGHSGDYIIDNGRYKNFVQAFSFTLDLRGKELSTAKNSILSWLRSANDYSPLWFKGYPNFYYLALPYQAVSFEFLSMEHYKVTINFYCEPFLPRIDGLEPIIFQNSLTLENTESWASEPIITLNGSGTLKINDYEANIESTNKPLVIDSSAKRIYSQDEQDNYNNHVTLPNFKFPRLLPGTNVIEFSGSGEVKPRWQTLA